RGLDLLRLVRQLDQAGGDPARLSWRVVPRVASAAASARSRHEDRATEAGRVVAPAPEVDFPVLIEGDLVVCHRGHSRGLGVGPGGQPTCRRNQPPGGLGEIGAHGRITFGSRVLNSPMVAWIRFQAWLTPFGVRRAYVVSSVPRVRVS